MCRELTKFTRSYAKKFSDRLKSFSAFPGAEGREFHALIVSRVCSGCAQTNDDAAARLPSLSGRSSGFFCIRGTRNFVTDGLPSDLAPFSHKIRPAWLEELLSTIPAPVALRRTK